MKLLRDVPPGGDGLVVLRSEHWGYNSIGIASGTEACAVDPGLSPAEIEAFRAALTAGGRRVTTVLLTHSHHDHIRGWDAFPGARVIAPLVVRDKDEGPQRRILAAKQKFDERLGAHQPKFRYPAVDEVFDESASFTIGSLEVEAHFLPGHSNCTSIALVKSLGAMLTADYLVTPGLPYCRWEPGPFEAAHHRMGELVRTHGIELVVPAHNELIEGSASIHAALQAELDYFAHLRQLIHAARQAGLGKDELLRRCAEQMGERRGIDLGPRARQDGDNARRVLAELSASGA